MSDPTRAFDAVLFDWCGTLVGYPSKEQRIRLALAELGRSAEDAEVARLSREIRSAQSHPLAVDADARCDLSAADHAEARRVLFDLAGLDHELAGRIERTYGDLATYDGYPEVVEVLTLLADRGVKLAIVSDFHVDLRPHFVALGLLDCIAGFAISCEVGVTKPDPLMFETALDFVGVKPERCLMVGDRSEPDGGAAELGIATLILPVPAPPRPRLLDRVVSLVFPAQTGLSGPSFSGH